MVLEMGYIYETIKIYLRGPDTFTKSFLLLSDLYETSHGYVKLNLRNILFMAIFILPAYFISYFHILKEEKQFVSPRLFFNFEGTELFFFITLFKPLSSNLSRNFFNFCFYF